jgi:hypothetical protein
MIRLGVVNTFIAANLTNSRHKQKGKQISQPLIVVSRRPTTACSPTGFLFLLLPSCALFLVS